MKKSQFINHYINQRKFWRLKGNEDAEKVDCILIVGTII